MKDRRILVLVTAVVASCITWSLSRVSVSEVSEEAPSGLSSRRDLGRISSGKEGEVSATDSARLSPSPDGKEVKKETKIESLAEAVELNAKFKRNVSLKLGGSQAARKKEKIIKEYSDLFSANEGLSPEKVEVLSQAIYEIEKSRVEAQYLLDNLEYQKNDFDKLVKGSLTEAEYEDYRSYEENKGREEYLAEFDAFIDRAGIADLKGPEKESLRALLGQSQTGAIIDNTAGPYGNPPSLLGSIYEPNSPAQKFFIEDQVSLLSGERDFLQQQAESEAQARIIERFYNERINEVLSLPDE